MYFHVCLRYFEAVICGMDICHCYVPDDLVLLSLGNDCLHLYYNFALILSVLELFSHVTCC